MKNDYIPKQRQGASTDIVKNITLKNKEEAIQQFTIAREHLLNISHWAQVTKGPSSTFCLTNNEGKEVTRPARENDHIKINLPGLGSWLGGGNDWVRIELVRDYIDTRLDEEFIVITVRPSPNPLSESTVIAHFFEDTATSTFIVERNGLSLNSEVHGRNELPNTKTRWTNRVRNRLIGLSVMAGFSSPQWKNLVKGLLKS